MIYFNLQHTHQLGLTKVVSLAMMDRGARDEIGICCYNTTRTTCSTMSAEKCPIMALSSP
jgi:hypothetical protein